MKIRTGFVSNSSSSSFLIAKRYVSDHQLELIENHIEKAYKVDPTHDWPWECSPHYVKRDDEWSFSNRWSITVDEDLVEGYTTMDNFDMHHFLEEIGIPMDRVRWDYNG